MRRKENIPRKFDSLPDFHRAFGLQQPTHPLISFINIEEISIPTAESFYFFILNFYKIAYKNTLCGQARYGQNYYDFGEGGLIFTAPNQVFESPKSSASGYIFFIHPDFLLTYPLAKKMKEYGFFSYAANEALHLSAEEKATIIAIFKIIDDELKSRIDDFSHDVVISQIELLLNYSNRFYNRQFLTHKAVYNNLLLQLEDILEAYFNGPKPLNDGLPSVHYLAEQVNVSPGYLSDMLRSLTGQNAQQHIHHKLVEKAKQELSTTLLSVGEIAHTLGFEHPQSFSKFFKAKTKLTPLEFRKLYN
ncbi:helix-turn-helix domain-containing protein [Ulvibacterium marinum]|uniref:AraC family transcriptional regulator n=1 Tax=Ulvibacterium marinum TaxID=2419782 RepID=A0A3B0C2U4_9FLAO|nr:response regulator transcription factor [Ulvibacterium marinum]RKN79420.1 AraC family transcriptional regulator [Ulvibacterium marinum]